MAGVNKCIFVGNVGKIETRYMQNGDAVTNISLAVNEKYKNKEGERVEKTEWVNVVIYRKLAEIAGQYIKVGDQIYISGKQSTRKWQDKEGKDRYTTEIIASEMQMLGGPRGGGGGYESAASAPAQGGLAATASSSPNESGGRGGFEDFDDDIPF